MSVERIVCTISRLFSLGRVFRIVVCFDFVCLVCLVGRGLRVVCAHCSVPGWVGRAWEPNVASSYYHHHHHHHHRRRRRRRH